MEILRLQLGRFCWFVFITIKNDCILCYDIWIVIWEQIGEKSFTRSTKKYL